MNPVTCFYALSPRDFSPAERREINRIGAQGGCHTCGRKDPGTPTGDFIFDVQPPDVLAAEGTAQSYYPHCLAYSTKQGRIIRDDFRIPR